MYAQPYAPSIRIPSSVSMRLIPAVKANGSNSMEIVGMFCAPLIAARLRSATSLAVSNPRPKSSPTGYIFQLSEMLFRKGRRNFAINPLLCR